MLCVGSSEKHITRWRPVHSLGSITISMHRGKELGMAEVGQWWNHKDCSWSPRAVIAKLAAKGLSLYSSILNNPWICVFPGREWDLLLPRSLQCKQSLKGGCYACAAANGGRTSALKGHLGSWVVSALIKSQFIERESKWPVKIQKTCSPSFTTNETPLKQQWGGICPIEAAIKWLSRQSH